MYGWHVVDDSLAYDNSEASGRAAEIKLIKNVSSTHTHSLGSSASTAPTTRRHTLMLGACEDEKFGFHFSTTPRSASAIIIISNTNICTVYMYVHSNANALNVSVFCAWWLRAQSFLVL